MYIIFLWSGAVKEGGVSRKDRCIS